MAIGGAFLGGGVEVVPAGSCKLELEILTEDRANLTATFTIKGTSTYTVTAGADGRAVYTVPSGQTYTVSVNTTGYDNLASQTVVAESGTVRYVRFEAVLPRVKMSGGGTLTGNYTVDGQLGVKASAYIYSGLMFPASDDGKRTRMAFRGVGGKDGDRIMMLIDNNQNYAPITILSNLTAPKITIGDNNVLPHSVTPTDKTDNSTRVATTAWINQADFLVHSVGAETVSGVKTFTALPIINGDGNTYLIVKASDISLGTTGKGSYRYGLEVVDSKNTIFGQFQTVHDGNLHTRCYMGAKGKNATWKYIQLYHFADGTSYAEAPNPDTGDPEKIATTDWSIGKFVQKSGDTMTGLLNLDSLQFTSSYGSWRFRPSGTGFPVLSVYANNDSSKPFIQMSLSSNELRLGGDLNRVISNYPIATDDNTKVVATTAWVSTASCVVHTYDAESILGLKTFKDPIHLVNDMVSYTQSQDAGTWTYLRGIEFRDKASERMGEIRSVRYTNTVGVLVNSTEIIARGKDNIDTLLAIVTADNGQKYAYCPSTPTNATNNIIATADWVNAKVGGKNKVTDITSYAQLIELIKNGKRGDSFGITMDYVGSSFGGISATDKEVHAFGHYTIDEITVSDGALAKLEAFGSGEVSGKLKPDDNTTYTYATTGFGRLAIGSAVIDAFRVVEDGKLTLLAPNDASASITSFEGYYISI